MADGAGFKPGDEPNAMRRSIVLSARSRLPPSIWLPVIGLASVGILTLLRKVRRLRAEASRLVTELAEARAESQRQMKLRMEERAGRTGLQKRLREQQSRTPKAAQAQSTHTYTAIGRVSSCFVERRGTPRQGCLVPGARAELKLSSHVVQASAALEGLDLFSHVWLIYEFHENTNADKKQQVRAKVHPPALGGAKIGLFATRTPHRPNAIGLTVARLLAVRGDTLLLGGADLVNGTPVLDVKPYLRHDIRPEASVPSWCEPVLASSLIREVEFSEAASAALAASVPRLRLYDDEPTVRDAIVQTLLLDIRSVHQGRGEAAAGQRYHVRLDKLDITFETYESHVLVTSVECGNAFGASGGDDPARDDDGGPRREVLYQQAAVEP